MHDRPTLPPDLYAALGRAIMLTVAATVLRVPVTPAPEAAP